MELHDLPKPEEFIKEDVLTPPETPWMATPTVFKDGTYSFPSAAKNLRRLGMPNPREWSPTAEDWKLPEDWKNIVLERHKGEACQIPFVPHLHGLLRQMRSMC